MATPIQVIILLITIVVETVEMVVPIIIVEAIRLMVLAVAVEVVMMDLTVLEYMVVEMVVGITQTSLLLEVQTEEEAVAVVPVYTVQTLAHFMVLMVALV